LRRRFLNESFFVIYCAMNSIMFFVGDENQDPVAVQSALGSFFGGRVVLDPKF